MLSIVAAPTVSPMDLANCFGSGASGPYRSPIDLFMDNTNSINILFSGPTPPTEVQRHLIVSGYVSAVESYMRAIVREIINVDEVALGCAESQMVSFGAALNYSDEMLPEALLENSSLAGTRNLKNLFKKTLGIEYNFPVEDLLVEFGKICEFRHCIVHRFGKIGSKNAISLGITDYKDVVEKNLELDDLLLASVAENLRTLVKVTNNFMYDSLLKRSAGPPQETWKRPYSSSWTWDLRRDKKRFRNYHQIFESTSLVPPSSDLTVCYRQFRSRYKP